MTENQPSRTAILICAITLAGLLLNGATPPALRLLVMFLMAGAIAIAPPQHRHGRWLNVLFLLALAIPLSAFLPSSLFPTPAWRTAAAELGISLPDTVSPQPWLSAESVCLLVAGLAWLYYVSSMHWTRLERSLICRGIALASILLGAAYIALKLSGHAWPGAQFDDQFGPFPNKNQTGSFLLLGGVLTAGLLVRPGGQRRSKQIAWGVGLAILIAALAVVGSRTSITLFAIAAISVSIRRAKLSALAFIGSALLLSLAALLLGDAEILRKFSGDEGIVTTTSGNGRWPLYSDTMAMVNEAPLTGTGLGNFEDVFALHRERSSAPNRALHPDSDLAWTLAELGLPGAIVLAVLVIAIFRLALPSARDPASSGRRDRALRFSCFVAALAFAAQALVDVPAHRLGAVLPAILVLSLGIGKRRCQQASTQPMRWTLTACALIPPLLVLVLPMSTRCLDAGRYFASARDHLEAGRFSEARADFERASFLRPDNPQLPLAEGELWFRESPHHAMAAWRRGLEIARRHGREVEQFHEICQLAAGRPGLAEELWLLASGRPELLVVALARSDAEQSRMRWADLLSSNPELEGWDRLQLTSALREFVRHHTDDELLELIDRHRAWAPLCWRALSAAYASRGDHERAFEIISAACPPPDLSILQTGLAIDALRADHLRSPEKLTTTVRLAHQYMRRGNQARALELLSEVASDAKTPPAIVQYMMAHCFAQGSEPQKAHEALLSYVDSL